MRPSDLFNSLIVSAQSLSTRRLFVFFSGILALSIIVLITTSAHLSSPNLQAVNYRLPDSVSSLKDKVHVPQIFGPTPHTPEAPPAEADPTSSTEGWFSSWGWLHPFSGRSGEDRIALPHVERCAVYTYYVPSKDKNAAKVEDRMLLAWRRAWWAYGFKPMILGLADAKANKLHEQIFRVKLTPELEAQTMGWLAWSHVGKGLMVDYRVLPMGPRDDSTIVALGRCEFQYMSRFKDFEQKLYSSDKASIDKILTYITTHPQKEGDKIKTIEQAIAKSGNVADMIHLDSIPTVLADYTPEVVKEKYKDLKPVDLPDLVNAHLHSTFLEQHNDGITVLSPFNGMLDALHQPALELANRIAACPAKNPLPGSCPLNIPNCMPCTEDLPVSNHEHLPGTGTNSFVLGTVPHPFITTEMTIKELSLLTDSNSRSISFIRRKTIRDSWVKEVTKVLMDDKLGSQPRVSKIKELVAVVPGKRLTAIWSTDKQGFKDTEWTLGFELSSVEELKLKLPAGEEAQKDVLNRAKKAVAKEATMVCVVEAWNMGDTEAWKFVNAWRERRIVERTKWTKMERRYGQGLGKEER